MESKSFDKILIVDDDRDVLVAAQLLLKQYAERVDTEADPNRIPGLLQNDTYDVILLDMNFAQDATSGKEGFHWLSRILEIDASAVVILITAYGGVETAVQAIKEGATDFVLKPWQNEKLLATLSAAVRLRRSRLEVNQLRAEQEQIRADMDREFPDMVGTSRAMCEVFDTIKKWVLPTRMCSFWARMERGKMLLPAPCTVDLDARQRRLFALISALFQRVFLKASFLGTKKVLLLMREKTARGVLKSRRVVRFFWMRLAIFRCRFRQSC